MIHVTPPPIFVKSNFSFHLNGQDYTYLNQGVSVFGVSGIRWLEFDPTDWVGAKTAVTVDVLAKQRYRFTTQGMVTAEVGLDSTNLGIKFYLNDQERSRLAATIAKEGYYPTNYIRKFPRIPAAGKISTMPMRAIVELSDGDLIVFDIANISPSGLLLHTENPKAVALLPGMRVFSQVEPRGENGQSFDFQGMVCRVVLDKNPESQNISRYLGVKLTQIRDADKEVFLSVLKNVLITIKSAQ